METRRFDAAVARFAATNAQDPEQVSENGVPVPRTLAHACWLSGWIERLTPNASEALRLAAHCQHLARWTTPRSTYPEGRRGYLTWRRDRAKFHAELAGKVLRDVGYDDETVDRVRRINLKQGLGQVGDAQTMEDALCLTFLEHEAAAFAGRHDAVKVTEILRKTWMKMSPRAREFALAVELPTGVRELLEAALGTP